MKRLLERLRHPHAAAAALFLAPLAVLFAARIALLAAYEDFAALGGAEIALAFLRGLRFDLSVTAGAVGLPVVALVAPVASRVWRLAWGWLGFAAVVAVALLAIGDAVYFGAVHRHTGPEAAELPRELPRLAALAVAEMPAAIAAFAGVVVAAGWGWRALLARSRAPEGRGPWIAVALAAPLLVVLVRGGVQSKPIGIVNAFDDVSRPAGTLALNGAFSIAHSFLGAKPVSARYMEPEAARTMARAHLASPRETFVAPEFPLLRHRTAEPRGKPNVVVVMLEGWHPGVVDAYRERRGLAPLGATPVFDALARDGMLFESFYANGQRSAESFSAILAGIPALPGVGYIGRGMEQNRLPFVGRIAKENGWRSTIFVRGAHRDSFRLDAIAHLAGFDRYLGFEDIDALDGKGKEHPWGAHDERTFRLAREEFARAEKPFLGFVFTLSTHRPWGTPGGADGAGNTDEERYLATVRYADRHLGALLEGAREDGWLASTVFVLVSDHYPPLPSRDAADLPAKHHVPMLIVGPGIAPAVRADPASHVDLLPTLMDLAGWSGTHAALGRSLVEPPSGAVAAGPIVTGDLVSWIAGDGSVLTHDLRGGAPADERERRLLALVQLTLEGLRTNRISR